MFQNASKITGDFFATHLIVNILNFKQIDTIFDNRQLSEYFKSFYDLIHILCAKYSGVIIKTEIDFCEIVFGLKENDMAKIHMNPLLAVAFAIELQKETEKFNSYLTQRFHKNFNEIEKRLLMFPKTEVEDIDADSVRFKLQIIANSSRPGSKKYSNKLSMTALASPFYDSYFSHGGVPTENRSLLRVLKEPGLFIGKNIQGSVSGIVESEPLQIEGDYPPHKVKGYSDLKNLFHPKSKLFKELDRIPEKLLELETKNIASFRQPIVQSEIREIEVNAKFCELLNENFNHTTLKISLAYLLARELGLGEEKAIWTGYSVFLNLLDEFIIDQLDGIVMFETDKIIDDLKFLQAKELQENPGSDFSNIKKISEALESIFVDDNKNISKKFSNPDDLPFSQIKDENTAKAFEKLLKIEKA